jgi:uncharacterized protein (TIGR02594 family)
MNPPFYRAVVNARALRLRESPSLESATVASLPRGTAVEVLPDGTTSPIAGPYGVWVHVRAGKRIGWMCRKYLTPEDHQAAPPSEVEEFPWMPLALGEVGVTEVPGPGDNPRIAQYLHSTDLDSPLAAHDSTLWCSGFINWCVERSGYAGTNSAAARSWLDWGRPVTLPRRGIIAVLERGAFGGHVGFFVRKDAGATGKLWLLGGNQANSVNIAGYDPARLLGYRVPSR